MKASPPPSQSDFDRLQPPAPGNAGNAFFRWLARGVLRWRFVVLLLFALGTAVMAYLAATRLQIDSSTEAFLSSNDESSRVLEALRAAFGKDTVFQILVTGDVFTEDYLKRLRDLHREVDALDMDLETLGQRRSYSNDAPELSQIDAPANVAGDFADFEEAADGDDGWGDEGGSGVVEQTISLINVRRTRFESGGLRVFGLLDDWPSPHQLPEIKREVLDDPTLVGQVVGPDGKHSVIIVRTQFMSEADSGRVYSALLDIASKHQSEGFVVEVAGSTSLFVALNSRMMRDLGLTFGVSTALMVLIMSYLFRHPIGVIGPQVVCIQAAVCTMGALALTGRPVTMVTNVLPAFLACVGIGDAIHVQSVYRDARVRGYENRDAIVYAVGATGVPILFTSLTTAIGLLSFRFAHLQAIQDMGIFGAFGVMVALLNSLIVLPITLSFNHTSLFGATQATHTSGRMERFLRTCNGLSRQPQHRRTVLLIGAALGLASVGTASTLTVYHNALTWFPKDDVARLAIEHLDDNVGGTATISLLIEAPPGDTLKHRDTLVALQNLERHVLAYRDPQYPEGMVTNVTSLLDVVRESWRAVHENAVKFYALPDGERGVLDMLTLFENASPSELSQLATVDLAKSVMTVRAHWVDAWSYRPLVAHMEEGFRKYIHGGVAVKTTGTVYSTVSVVDTLIGDLLRSFGTAFVVITIFMVLLLRDLRLGLIAMVPNLLPILMVVGCMVPAHIHVDTNTLMVASVAIGIAVDDTIHFLHQFQAHMRAHGDVEAAIDHAFSHTGRAMIATSVILVAGFIAMNVAYMGNVKTFGSLISVTVIFALFADLILCPALLRTFYKTRENASL